MPVPVSVLIFSIAGAMLAAFLACLPGLHVYNVMGLAVLALHGLGRSSEPPPPEILIPLFAGLTIGYAMLNTIPSILLAAPDESAMFTVMPGQKYLLHGRGYEGVMLTTLGGLAGLLLLLVVIGPLAPKCLPRLQATLAPHSHWVIWCIIAFMLMSEWPKGGTRGQGGWSRFLDGWKATGAGLATFLLAGLLGCILFFKSPIAPDQAFQNLMPAFAGLFTLPWLLLNITSHAEIPPQSLHCGRLLPDRKHPETLLPMVKGAIAGVMGGGFAAFFPVVTGGVGGFLAGRSHH